MGPLLPEGVTLDVWRDWLRDPSCPEGYCPEGKLRDLGPRPSHPTPLPPRPSRPTPLPPHTLLHAERGLHVTPHAPMTRRAARAGPAHGARRRALGARVVRTLTLTLTLTPLTLTLTLTLTLSLTLSLSLSLSLTSTCRTTPHPSPNPNLHPEPSPHQVPRPAAQHLALHVRGRAAARAARGPAGRRGLQLGGALRRDQPATGKHLPTKLLTYLPTYLLGEQCDATNLQQVTLTPTLTLTLTPTLTLTLTLTFTLTPTLTRSCALTLLFSPNPGPHPSPCPGAYP